MPAGDPASTSTEDGAADGAASVPPPVGWCAHCGAPLAVESFVQEYWTSGTRVFHCWCSVCDFVADVTPTERVVTHEPAHTA